ncbi:MAG TPA: ABC transporter substrate-binding protein [Chthoniobacteraceae bacterium]|jgi:NitT/TauT family transport system substrate-binding protein|nr:ABC transporter substrate-binding protein [Chthoniobacteraceae bacterium]
MKTFITSNSEPMRDFARKKIAIAGAPAKQTLLLPPAAGTLLMKTLRILLAVLVVTSITTVVRAQQTTLRVGHFPNITHAQALVASQLSHEGKGWFEERLGKDVKIQWFVYNAGPSAMEALAANSIDLTYVGPNPALNLYVKAQGEEVRIIAGAATGGAALVVQPDGRLSKPADFKGRAIATPQLGNTQDVACRAWLKKQGYKITQIGGEVKVLPTANPDQLALFSDGKLDGVWTVEPWVSRLELEAKGKIFLEQKDTITTVLVSSVKALKERAALVKKFAEAHAELTKWINEHPEEAKKLANAALKEHTKREMPPELINHSWPRITFTADIKRESLESFVAEAKTVGFLKEASDLSRLVSPP